MDKNEFYDSRDEYLEHAGVKEKLGKNKYLDRNFARPYSSPNTTGKYDNPNAQAWVNKEGYYTENNTRAYSESVQNLVDQISAQLSKSENDKKRNSNAYFKAMKSVISREIGELADAILKIESSGSRKAYNKDLEDLRRRFNALSFGNDYIAHAAFLPKNPRKNHKYLYIDKNGRYVYEEPKKSSRPYSSPNQVSAGGKYTAEDQRVNASNLQLKRDAEESKAEINRRRDNMMKVYNARKREEWKNTYNSAKENSQSANGLHTNAIGAAKQNGANSSSRPYSSPNATGKVDLASKLGKETKYKDILSDVSADEYQANSALYQDLAKEYDSYYGINSGKHLKALDESLNKMKDDPIFWKKVNLNELSSDQLKLVKVMANALDGILSDIKKLDNKVETEKDEEVAHYADVWRRVLYQRVQEAERDYRYYYTSASTAKKGRN